MGCVQIAYTMKVAKGVTFFAHFSFYIKKRTFYSIFGIRLSEE